MILINRLFYFAKNSYNIFKIYLDQEYKNFKPEGFESDFVRANKINNVEYLYDKSNEKFSNKSLISLINTISYIPKIILIKDIIATSEIRIKSKIEIKTVNNFNPSKFKISYINYSIFSKKSNLFNKIINEHVNNQKLVK